MVTECLSYFERRVLIQEQLFPDPSQLIQKSASSFQARSSQEGRRVAEVAQQTFAAAGFEVVECRRVLASLGVEVNLIARDQIDGDWYVEISGAFQSKRPGLVRTDTVRKVLGSAFLLASNGFRPFIVLTTDTPRPGTVGHRWLHQAGPETIFDIIVIGSKQDFRRLQHYAEEGFERGALPGWWAEEELNGPIRPLSLQTKRGTNPLDYLSNEGLEVTRFTHYVELMIPSRDHQGRSIDPVEIATIHRDLVRWLADRNGGLIRQQLSGAWIDAESRQVDENLVAVRSWSNSAVGSVELEPFIERMLDELHQESISVIIDGEMLLYSRSHTNSLLRIQRTGIVELEQ